MDLGTKLIKALNNYNANIGIIGLGYVGLPLSLSFVEGGYNVIGFDIDEEKINCINKGRSYINHIADTRVSDALKSKDFFVTSDFSYVSKLDSIIICVPTPLTKHRDPDLSFIVSTIDSIIPFIHEGQVLSLESTTYPGTTEEVVMPQIESCGLKVGEDFFLVYSPEREDPGNTKYNTKNIPKIVGGFNKKSTEIGIGLYQNIVETVVPVSSLKVAEMTKLLENIHRSVNIGLMNELKVLSNRMDIDLYEVIEAASTKPFGFVPYYPGPGLGGHCIPIDPYYLTWKAREYDLHTRFIELAGEINTAMPDFVVRVTIDSLNDFEKSLNKSKILILGVAYKKNVEDIRESPALRIIELLLRKGSEVSYFDPYVKSLPKTRKYNFKLSSIDSGLANLNKYDAVILITDHDLFDYDLIKNKSKLIIDTRGRYNMGENIVRA